MKKLDSAHWNALIQSHAWWNCLLLFAQLKCSEFHKFKTSKSIFWKLLANFTIKAQMFPFERKCFPFFVSKSRWAMISFNELKKKISLMLSSGNFANKNAIIKKILWFVKNVRVQHVAKNMQQMHGIGKSAWEKNEKKNRQNMLKMPGFLDFCFILLLIAFMLSGLSFKNLRSLRIVSVCCILPSMSSWRRNQMQTNIVENGWWQSNK